MGAARVVRALGAAGAATAPQDPGCGAVDPGCGLSISAEIPWRSLAEEQGYPEAGRSTDKHWDGGMPQELAVPWNAPGPSSSTECPRTQQFHGVPQDLADVFHSNDQGLVKPLREQGVLAPQYCDKSLGCDINPAAVWKALTSALQPQRGTWMSW